MQKHECGTELVRINGRTIRSFAEGTLGTQEAKRRFGKSAVTDWVSICPNCDAYALGVDMKNPCAFLSVDGVMRTMADFDWGSSNTFKSEVLDFYGFKFSKSALYSSVNAFIEDEETRNAEVIGENLLKNSSPSMALAFSEAVVTWGRGSRVWGNLKRFHSDNLGEEIDRWVVSVVNAQNDEDAIRVGVGIKGLGVSFASKHLRMLNPEKYAVLDEVLSNGLGIALNEKGYALFMRLLRDFKEKIGFEYSLAFLEMGIFNLVRQQVRSIN